MIKKSDTIVTAFTTNESGPGWINKPLWVIVSNENGRLRQECFQPEEQSRDILLLSVISEKVNIEMVNAVLRWDLL